MTGNIRVEAPTVTSAGILEGAHHVKRGGHATAGRTALAFGQTRAKGRRRSSPSEAEVRAGSSAFPHQ